MTGINDEMRVTADYAISIAKERYGLDLDYSDDSLAVLDNILEKIYWGFSGHSKDEGEGGLIYNSAIIWGSYLGEYMRLKWGGTWLLKGAERRISITSIEFSPISFIFQRITNHPEYSVKNFIQETKNVIYSSVIHAPKPQYVAETVRQPTKPAPVKLAKKPLNIDKRWIYITGGVLGLLIVLTASIAGYALISQDGVPGTGSTDPTSTFTASSLPTDVPSATVTIINPTMTELPTYTPNPTNTPRPSRTPLFTSTLAPTDTPTITPTPTETETEYVPPTRTYTRTPTQKPAEPTFTPTNTPRPSPTNTAVTPALVSCGVSPSQDVGERTTLTFTVQFNVPGYGMSVGNFSPPFPEQRGCADDNTDGNATASCQGNSGLVPPETSVDVTINTPLGGCTVTYSTPKLP